MSDLIILFRLPFMQNALIAGLAVAVMTGVLGVFIVQRRMSFLGDGLAHSAFGGVALALFIGMSQPLWLAMPFALVVALGIAWVRNRTQLSNDTTIGIFFAVSVALGVLFVSLRRDYTVDAWHWLFGSILGVGRQELYIILLTGALGLAVLIALWARLAYSTFDEELAATDGVRVELLEYILLAISAVMIVASVRVVGVILMAAYLVIPAASARLLSRSLMTMTLLSVTLGVTSTGIGLMASYFLDVPSGSTIVLTQALLFVVAAVFARHQY